MTAHMSERIKFISENCDQTFEIGNLIGSRLKKGDIVTLNGELGAGKTAITKGICSFFGVENVNSPTFALMNVYEFDEVNQINTIYHFDAYRLNENAWENEGFHEFLYGKNQVAIVEWAGNINLVGNIDIKICYDHELDAEKRIITINNLTNTF